MQVSVTEMNPGKDKQVCARAEIFKALGHPSRVAPIMEKTKSASRILAIDGCQLYCVAETLRQAGVESFTHLRVTDLGLEKGSAPVNDASIEKAAVKGCGLMKS